MHECMNRYKETIERRREQIMKKERRQKKTKKYTLLYIFGLKERWSR